MRIVSLLPSATEILFAVGAGDDVVGVTFECDHPAQARERQVVSSTTLPDGLTPAEIDAFVGAAVAAGTDLYRLDADALTGLDADLVVTQDLCAVCAVDVDTVDAALQHLGCTADVLTVDPHDLDEVLGSIARIGAAAGHEAEAEQLVTELRASLDAVRLGGAGKAGERVLVLEWTDPPYAPGHWIPEQVALAGGVPALGVAGQRSGRVTWDDVRASAPDVVVCAPCGFGVEQAAALAREVLPELPSGVPVWAVDANGEFARPGPRLVDGVETLAGILRGEAPRAIQVR